jgi:phosphatidylglycerol lysyltransferase
LKSPEGKIVTFLNIIPDFAPDETTYDMFRRTADSPNGAMDAVMVKLIEATKELGKKHVNIGLTPLGGITTPDNIVENAMKYAYQRFGTFKQYKTMRDFKEKYADSWKNKYIIYSNEVELMQLPMALNNVMKA